MLAIFVISYVFTLTDAFQHFVAINCGSYDRTMVSTKYANYTSDSYFQGLASTPQPKQSVPETIKNLADRELVKNHRTTNSGYNKFSYQPIIRENGNFLAIFTFVETQYRSKGERIFHIKLGEEVMHTVDIVEEVGFGKLLHKWIQFQVRDEVIYINGTYPALNGINYKTHQVRFVFDSVKGKPKLEALLVVKGSDIKQYLDSFLLYEQQKNVMVKEYLADKYRRPLERKYRVLNSTDQFKERKSEGLHILYKLLSLRSLGCILCALFAIHHQTLFAHIQRKLKTEKEKEKKD